MILFIKTTKYDIRLGIMGNKTAPILRSITRLVLLYFVRGFFERRFKKQSKVNKIFEHWKGSSE